MPRVMPEAYSGVEDGGETGGGSGVAPLQEFVSNSCGAGSRFVGCAREIAGDFLVGNGREISRGEQGGVRGVGVGDRLWDDREEPIRQDLAKVCVGGGKSTIKFQEGGDFVGASTVAPSCGFPQGIAGDCGEVIVRPPAFCLRDGLSECFNGSSS